RNPELVRFLDRDVLLLRVHHEDRTRQAAHVLHAGQVLLELDTLAIQQQPLLLRVELEGALFHPPLQILEPADLLLDRLEVREHPAQPTLRHVERFAAASLLLDDRAELALGAHEEHTLALQRHVAHDLLRLLQRQLRLLEIDDVSTVAIREDETTHLRVPTARPVPEMDPRFQQVPELYFLHLRRLSSWG